MRLMAAPTLRVAGAYRRGERRVTGVAPRFEAIGSMRKSAMAAFALPVASERRGQGRLLLMTACARRVIGQREPELVRRVALRAGDACVEAVLGRGNLMTGAARSIDRSRACRVGVMTTRARLPRDFRMIRMDRLMTLRADGISYRSHVVRRVAVLASLVRGDTRHSEHVDVLVARTAGRSRFLREIVWSVTADALLVTFGEERRRGYLGLRLRVASGASRESLGGGRVRVRVARGASLGELFALYRVSRRNLLVALRAWTD